jgi:hypothetical protein
MALTLDVEAEQLTDLRVVVDEQDGRHDGREYDRTVKDR